MNSELYKLWQEIDALRERVQELERYTEEPVYRRTRRGQRDLKQAGGDLDEH